VPTERQPSPASKNQPVLSTRPPARVGLGPDRARARTTIRILGITGSLRRESRNRQLLYAAARTFPSGTEMLVFEALKEIPPFDEDDEPDPPPAVILLRAQIADADGVLIATPEYNGSLPGQLKNALDWASRPYATNVLRGKPVAVIGASPSPGGTAHANADTRRILARIGANVSDHALLVPRAPAQLLTDGTLADQGQSAQLTQLTRWLTATAGSAQQPRAA
jgi:chromate reductase